jgi:hypothetical protein
MYMIITAALLAALLIPTGANAQAKCTKSKSCGEALGYCLDFRKRNSITKEELPCEHSAAVCDKTGVWRGKYMRGTADVNACRIFTPKSG